MKHFETLDDCRKEIDSLDGQLLDIINQRMKVVERVGEIKHNNNSAVYRPEREKEIIERLTKLSQESGGVLNKEAIEAIFLELFAISRNLEAKDCLMHQVQVSKKEQLS
jgi:chorismate mutase/prephenate dehydratase